MSFPSKPAIVYIEPTNACNCNCIICPRTNMTRRVGMMQMGLFRGIIDQLAAAGGADVRLFNFGEPLLHPQLPRMVRYCRDARLNVRFQTNGILLTDEMSAALLDAGLTYLGVSVNALTPEEYGVMRPGFAFDDVRDKVRRFKRAAMARGQDVHVHVNAHIVAEDRESRRDDIVRFAHEWGDSADSLSVSGISAYDGIEYPVPSSRAATGAASCKPDEAVVCREPFDRLVIKWDGRATPCCADYDAVCVVGDLRTDSLLDVWNSSAMADLRRTVAERRYGESPLCRTCPKLRSTEFNIVMRKAARAG